MNHIISDFEKLFATIKNDKNNIHHLVAIKRLIDIFERKYNDDYKISIRLLVIYLRKQLKELEQNLKQIA